MSDRKDILSVIFSAIDDVNQLLPYDQKLKKSTDTILSGQEGGLDSLGLINLIVAVEQKFQEKFKVSITLADERAMAQQDNPFRSVEILAEYIAVLTQGEKDAPST